MTKEIQLMKRYPWLIGLAVLLILSLACGASGGSGGGGNKTKFPLPGNVSSFTDTRNDSINFQTTLSLEDTIAFYRDAFGKQGLTERTINTAITDTTFSLVFDGDPSGKAIVVQGVDLGNGKTNVNIRYEDV
jgi:hypothetical protein